MPRSGPCVGFSGTWCLAACSSRDSRNGGFASRAAQSFNSQLRELQEAARRGCWDEEQAGECTQDSQRPLRSPPRSLVLHVSPHHNQFAQHQRQLPRCSFLYKLKILSPCATRVNPNPNLHWCKWRPTKAKRFQPRAFDPAPPDPPPAITHKSHPTAAGGLFARGLSKLSDSLK